LERGSSRKKRLLVGDLQQQWGVATTTSRGGVTLKTASSSVDKADKLDFGKGPLSLERPTQLRTSGKRNITRRKKPIFNLKKGSGGRGVTVSDLGMMVRKSSESGSKNNREEMKQDRGAKVKKSKKV